MSAKLQISNSTHSASELATILADYTSIALASHRQLYGGYSGSSYQVDLEDGTKYVLKVSNGYTADHAEFMCRTTYHLSLACYKLCCLPIPKSNKGDDNFKFVSIKEQNNVPAFLLTHVEGTQADKVMRENPYVATTVMRGIGFGLGKMHQSVVINNKDVAKGLGLRWYGTDGGCCDIQDQIDGKILDKISNSTAGQHRFVPFYRHELAELKSEMELSTDGTFGLGITHGDPFADNVLVNPKTGELASFIDIEDICVGPLLFDLACCAIGCCFKEAGDDTQKYPQVLDFGLLEALLGGYSTGRKLPSLEKQHFVQYMRLTLLCNCSWRFVKFNVDNTEDVPEEAKESYLELRRRIDYLHDSDVIQKIQSILEEPPAE